MEFLGRNAIQPSSPLTSSLSLSVSDVPTLPTNMQANEDASSQHTSVRVVSANCHPLKLLQFWAEDMYIYDNATDLRKGQIL